MKKQFNFKVDVNSTIIVCYGKKELVRLQVTEKTFEEFTTDLEDENLIWREAGEFGEFTMWLHTPVEGVDIRRQKISIGAPYVYAESDDGAEVIENLEIEKVISVCKDMEMTVETTGECVSLRYHVSL